MADLIDATGTSGGSQPMTTTAVAGEAIGDYDWQLLIYVHSAAVTISVPSDGQGTWALVFSEDFTLADASIVSFALYNRTLTGGTSGVQTWSTDGDLGAWTTLHAVSEPTTPVIMQHEGVAAVEVEAVPPAPEQIAVVTEGFGALNPTATDGLIFMGMFAVPTDLVELTYSQTILGDGGSLSADLWYESDDIPAAAVFTNVVGSGAIEVTQQFDGSISGGGATWDDGANEFCGWYAYISLGAAGFESATYPFEKRKVTVHALPYDLNTGLLRDL